jgi:hypothetical protein
MAVLAGMARWRPERHKVGMWARLSEGYRANLRRDLRGWWSLRLPWLSLAWLPSAPRFSGTFACRAASLFSPDIGLLVRHAKRGGVDTRRRTRSSPRGARSDSARGGRATRPRVHRVPRPLDGRRQGASSSPVFVASVACSCQTCQGRSVTSRTRSFRRRDARAGRSRSMMQRQLENAHRSPVRAFTTR